MLDSHILIQNRIPVSKQIFLGILSCYRYGSLSITVPTKTTCVGYCYCDQRFRSFQSWNHPSATLLNWRVSSVPAFCVHTLLSSLIRRLNIQMISGQTTRSITIIDLSLASLNSTFLVSNEHSLQ